jgi:hypothetical protein
MEKNTANDPIVQPEGLKLKSVGRSPEEYSWRILIQVVATQMHEYNAASSSADKALWKTRMWDTLIRINQKAQMYNPKEMPTNLSTSVLEYQAMSDRGESWCEALTRQLTQVFLNI